jgi:hypothetical protein
MEKPIIFNTEMVRAILDGRKTQTRRVVKDLPEDFPNGINSDVVVKKVGDFWCLPTSRGYKKSPYGGMGDTLWVRETWTYKPEWTKPAYRADWKTPDKAIETMDAKWWPSIHMPRWASRLTLRVVNVRAERVQQIEPRDCVAEGVYNAGSLASNTMYREAFAALWDSINAKRGYSWNNNPWVWVVEFEVVK